MNTLEILYHTHRANCCKCGCELSVYANDESLGDYFALDVNGNFYCTKCEDILVDIYVPEEKESEESSEEKPNIDCVFLPIIDVDNLEDVLKAQHPELEDKFEFLASVLFGEDYYNDSYKSYYFRGDNSFKNYSWQNEEHCEVLTCVDELLKAQFPAYDTVLINVSW